MPIFASHLLLPITPTSPSKQFSLSQPLKGSEHMATTLRIDLSNWHPPCSIFPFEYRPGRLVRCLILLRLTSSR